MNQAKVDITPEIGKWHHMLVVRKNTRVTLYSNGAKVGGGKLRENKGQWFSTIGYLGSTQISDVRIFRRALSAEEATRLHAQDTKDTTE